MKKKIKLRDMTEEQFFAFKDSDSCFKKSCDDCPFHYISCRVMDWCWAKHKDIYSDKFLDQEVEIEVPDILTEEERDYLKAVIEPFKQRIIFVSKNQCGTSEEYIQMFGETTEYAKSLLSCFPTSPSMRFDGLDKGNRYALEDLGL